MKFRKIGAVFGALSVALGAFGAHALKTRLSPSEMATYQTATQYMMAHALALLIARGWPAWAFTAGIVLFSGSLYLIVATSEPLFGAITPLGGIAFLAGWIGLVATSKD